VFVWVALGEEFANREKQAIADLSPLLNQQKTVHHQKLNLGIPESLLESHLAQCRDGEYTLFRLAPQSPAFEFGFDSVPIQQLSGFDNYCSYELYKSTSCIPDFPPPPPEYKPCYGILHTEMLSWLLVVAERSPLLDRSHESECLLDYDFDVLVAEEGDVSSFNRDQTMLAIGYDSLVIPTNKENPTEWIWDITLKQPNHGAVQVMPRFVHSILASEFSCYICPEEPTDEEREAWVKRDTGLTLSQYETVARAVWHQRDRSPYVIGRKSLQPLL
jgi:hypothetical protein